jgi:pyruvate kinase
VTGGPARAFVSLPQLPRVAKPGTHIFVNDGIVDLEVESVAGNEVRTRVAVGGEIRSRKGVNIPGLDLGVPAFTEHDRQCLEFALAHGVDVVEPVVRRVRCRRRPRTGGGARPRPRAVHHRQDRTGARARPGRRDPRGGGRDHDRARRSRRRVPIEQIAVLQKSLMRKAIRAAKPVITATQMLESMTHSRQPTRAEATDVANAILDGTDSVMLSAESASGAYPVESVATLARIATATEPHRSRFELWERMRTLPQEVRPNLYDLVAVAAEAVLEFGQSAAVVIPDGVGKTPRSLARFRLPVWIAGVTPTERVLRPLHLSYGVHPVRQEGAVTAWDAFTPRVGALARSLRQHRRPAARPVARSDDPESHDGAHRPRHVMKVGIVGCGMVGSASAFALVMRGVGREIVLVDANRARAEAEADDIHHAVPFANPLTVRAGGYEDLPGCRAVVIAAGVAQRPGETRLQLLERNAAVLGAVVPAILAHAPGAVLVVVSNPVDILTHVAAHFAAARGVPATRVIGSGRCSTLPASVRSSGVTSTWTRSTSTRTCWASTATPRCSPGRRRRSPACGSTTSRRCTGRPSDRRTATRSTIRCAARPYRIIAGKGATYYGIGSAVARLLDVILHDQRAGPHDLLPDRQRARLRGRHALAAASGRRRRRPRHDRSAAGRRRAHGPRGERVALARHDRVVAHGRLMIAARALVVVAFLLASPARGETVAETGPDQAIAAAIEVAHSGGKVVVEGEALASVVVLPDLYQRRAFRPAWTNPAATDGLLRAIRESADEGLDPADYHLAAIERMRASNAATPESQAHLDLLLTDAAVRLAYHLRFGKVDPEGLDPNWNMVSDLGGIDPVTVSSRRSTAAGSTRRSWS